MASSLSPSAPIALPLDGAAAPGTACADEACLPAKRAVVPGLCGLQNLGNTCYMNATLQCLSHTTMLTRPLLERGASLSAPPSSDLTAAYRSLLQEMWGGSAVVAPSAFRAALCEQLPQFEGHAQHDSPEFLGAVLERLHEEARAGRREEGGGEEEKKTLVREVFAGSLCNRLRCPGCGSESERREDFLCLPLPLPVTETKAVFVYVAGPLLASRVQYGLRVPWWSTVEDVLSRLSALATLRCFACLAVVSGRRVRRLIGPSCPVSDLSSSDGLWAFVLEEQLGEAAGTSSAAVAAGRAAARERAEASRLRGPDGRPGEAAVAAGGGLKGGAEEEEPKGKAAAATAAEPSQDEREAWMVAVRAEMAALMQVGSRPAPGAPAPAPGGQALAIALPPGPAPPGPREEDVQQVACVCGVAEEVARCALQKSGGSPDQAVMLILENPEAVGPLPPPASGPRGGDAPDAPGRLEPGEAEGQAITPVMPPAEPTSPGGSAAKGLLVDAVSIAHTRKAASALAAGADACGRDAAGVPLLHVALKSAERGRVTEKHAATVRLLLEARADPSATDGSGRSLGHRLAELGAEGLMGELRTAGRLDLEAKDSAGQTLLHKSAANGHAGSTALLLRWGARAGAQDAEGRTAAAIAANIGLDAVLDELLLRPRLLAFAHRLPVPQGGGVAGEGEAATAQGLQDLSGMTAQAAKEAGNACLKAGNFPGAIEQYTMAISLAGSDETSLVADCYNNRAAVHIQLRNYEDVVADATQCLERCPGNGKALVRRAQGYQQLEKMKAAYADITAALLSDTLSPGFAKIARSVVKDVRQALLADGVDLERIGPSVYQPSSVSGGAVSSSAPPPARPRYVFPAEPFVLSLPREREVSGRELYSLAWRRSAGEAPEPAAWGFELRSVMDWEAEEEGRPIPCDAAAAELPRGCAVVVQWEALPEELRRAPALEEHASVREAREEETCKVTLSSCLDGLTEPHTLGEDDAWCCPTCARPQAASLRSVIERPPRVLVLQLKRFYYTSRRRGKLSCPVEFPLEGLDLTPWCAASAGPAPTYDLFGVVNHLGGFGGGHYTANARPSSAMEGRDPGAWHHFNDGLCRPLGEDQVASREAYLLFYRRRPAHGEE